MTATRRPSCLTSSWPSPRTTAKPRSACTTRPGSHPTLRCPSWRTDNSIALSKKRGAAGVIDVSWLDDSDDVGIAVQSGVVPRGGSVGSQCETARPQFAVNRPFGDPCEYFEPRYVLCAGCSPKCNGSIRTMGVRP